jgi:type IV pilus assembly protein PilC
MAEFHCRLANNNGEIFTAKYTSASESELRQRLSEQGLFIYSIREGGRILSFKIGSGAKRIKQSEFIIFNQQFAALIHAGLPILKSLELVSQRMTNLQFREVLSEIANRVKAGALLSEAFEAAGIFPKVYTASLFAGEKSGSLEEVIRRFIEFQKTINQTRNRIRSALTYPAIVFFLMVVLVTFLMVKVVPEYATFYQSMNQRLPTPTLILIAVSAAIRNQILLAILLFGGIGLGLRLWALTPAGKLRLDGWKFKLPIVGDLWNKFAFSQLSRTLSILLSGGIPLVYSLEVVADSTGNQKITQTVRSAINSVKEGQSLSKSLETSEIVPGMAIEMIQVGESTGSLNEMLRHVADFYDEEVATRLNQVFTYVEPALLIVLATIVTYVMISLYLPIFQLSGMLSRQ